MTRWIRDATAADADACAAIYAPYVTGTAITFETEPPTAAQFAARIADAQERHLWIVLEDDGEIAGYAYAHRMHDRAAYQWSCETSIYLRQGLRRTGAGRALYTELLDRLRALGYRQAIASVTVPNEGSIGLHRAFGFEPLGTMRRIGWKDGAWRDVAWLQLDLAPGLDPAEPPTPLGQ